MKTENAKKRERKEKREKKREEARLRAEKRKEERGGEPIISGDAVEEGLDIVTAAVEAVGPLSPGGPKVTVGELAGLIRELIELIRALGSNEE